jgi:uncharacterized Ntn-hydrolase superfamily protein
MLIAAKFIAQRITSDTNDRRRGGYLVGVGFACQGSLLVVEDAIEAMAQAFCQSQGSPADRLVMSLGAGEKAGGDRRRRQASALYVVRPQGGYLGKNDVLADLRVDDHPDPVREPGRLLELQRLYSSSGPAEEKVTIDGAQPQELRRMMRKTEHYAVVTPVHGTK